MKMKKILSIFLSVVMVISSMAIVSAERTTVEVSTNADLITALNAGNDVKITDTFTVDDKVTVPDGTVIDLNGKTLNWNVEDSYFGTSAIKNGSIVFGKDDVHVCDGYFLINEGKTLTIDGVNITSAADGMKCYSVFHLKTGAALDVKNSTINVAKNEYKPAYVVYANEATAKADFTNSTVSTEDVAGVVHAATTITSSSFTIKGTEGTEMEHGINRSAVTIKDSDVSISGGTGRGITPTHGPLVIEGNSTVEIFDMAEASIEVRNNQTVTVAETSSVVVDTEVKAGTGTTDLVVSGTVTVNENLGSVAKVGDTGYTDFSAALEAAKSTSGAVTVEIYAKVTLNENLSGNYDSIKFVGKDADAEIYLDVQGYITATGKTVTFEDLKLSKSQGGFITNAGFMNVAFGVYDVPSVSYNNCVFSNGAYASSGKTTFTKCTFYRSHDKYALWAYGNVECAVDGCTFADYRGIKMYAEGAAKTVDLTVKNTSFSSVSDKPAIVLTYGESVTLEGNTYSDTGVFELDRDGAPNGTTVTADITDVACMNDNYDDCGVLVDGKIYTTVADAAAVASAGSTVTLMYDATETIEFPEGVTLNKNGYTAENVTVDGSSVVEVGEGKEYSTLNAAMEAVNGAKAEYHIYGEVTLETLFSHGDWTLGSVIGKTSDAKVTITGGGVTDLVSSSFKDITFADEGTYLPTANEFMYQNFENCTFENVVFEDAPRLSGTCTATNCTFNNSKDQKYALWMDEGSFTITGSAFVLKDIAYGTVKSDAAGSTLVLTNNTFINNSDSGKEALNTNGLIITATGNTFTDYTAGILPQDKTNTFNNETATGATVDDLVKKTNTVKTTPEVVVNWGTYTDAGFYTVSETEKAGMMRFLFAVDIYDEILETGIKYIKTANIEEEVDTATGVQGTESAFYGDVTGIPEGTDGTYLAVAYVKTAQGTYWSDVVECSPDFTKHFTEYQAQ